MKATAAQTPPKLSGPAIRSGEPSRCIARLTERHCYMNRAAPRASRMGFVIDCVLAAMLAVFLSVPTMAKDDWAPVDERQALLEFKDATCTRVVQRKDGETTLEKSYWTLDNGADVFFHVTRLGPRWVLTNRGPTLQEVFNRAFPNAELEEIGEPFVNRNGGTQGEAQWLRYRGQGNHCVLMRQYGWDDDAWVSGAAIALGNRVAVGTYCATLKLSNAEIDQLFKRIDF